MDFAYVPRLLGGRGSLELATAPRNASLTLGERILSRSGATESEASWRRLPFLSTYMSAKCLYGRLVASSPILQRVTRGSFL